ncbi:MAG: stage 0 sporulation family protein [Selenomonadaceae bacterium]|nr:stage 0 sporulation family protein [Selenomonadaceae bacterium]
MQIIGVRIRKAGRILFYEPNEEELKKGDAVIVETSRGLEYGKIVTTPRELLADETIESEPGEPLKKIYRKATDEDLIQLKENQANEKAAFELCLQKIIEHELPMKLINVEYTFDVNKIIFFFTADGRVDFRDLVRDLAAIFKTRIELRQVGVRDEAKVLGGMGGCGRPLCCASFLEEFIPVSIRMAKDQNLSLNPTKISGVCGRLMCCLKYENDLYCENCPQQNVTFKPRQGSRVVVADGEGKVVAVSYSRRNATILLDTNKTVVASWEDILPVNAEDFETVESAAPIGESPQAVEEIQPITIEEPPPKPERSEKYERPRRIEAFNRRYNRNENAEQDTRPERPPRPRGDKNRRPPRRDYRK